ncbi:FYVE_zinc finger domain-containing protein [Hexamita inflata]|uniref:FYVE zinc finger domain-containing protein n=1 Tax=Hexamita inflata TaxID=28002 RepID=A0AA86NVR7_9EUKA|nr:FYVE zinc finger domain-containing protein [Hexamita inflata]
MKFPSGHQKNKIQQKGKNLLFFKLSNTVQYKSFEEKNEILKAKMLQLQTTASNQMLQSLIIMPVQRVPRYTLFFANYAKFNKNERIKDLVERTLSLIKEKTAQMNAAIADHDNMETLREISRQILNAPDDLIIPTRKLIKDGNLVKLCRKDDKPRKIYLFNDSLLYASFIGDSKEDSKTMFNAKIYALKGCICNAKSTNQLEMLTNQKSFILDCASQQDRDEWLNLINQQIDKLKDNVMQKSLVKAAPIWDQDHANPNCILCNDKFTFLNRRHHCRLCGKVICGKCSYGKWILKNINESAKQRLCDVCMVGFDKEWETNPSVGKIMGNWAQTVNPIIPSDESSDE